jgi:hypothetical protein
MLDVWNARVLASVDGLLVAPARGKRLDSRRQR